MLSFITECFFSAPSGLRDACRLQLLLFTLCLDPAVLVTCKPIKHLLNTFKRRWQKTTQAKIEIWMIGMIPEVWMHCVLFLYPKWNSWDIYKSVHVHGQLAIFTKISSSSHTCGSSSWDNQTTSDTSNNLCCIFYPAHPRFCSHLSWWQLLDPRSPDCHSQDVVDIGVYIRSPNIGAHSSTRQRLQYLQHCHLS